MDWAGHSYHSDVVRQSDYRRNIVRRSVELKDQRCSQQWGQDLVKTREGVSIGSLLLELCIIRQQVHIILLVRAYHLNASEDLRFAKNRWRRGIRAELHQLRNLLHLRCREGICFRGLFRNLHLR